MPEDTKKEEKGPRSIAPAKQEGARNFGVFLNSLEEGQLMIDCSTQLHELNAAIAKLAVHSGAKAKGEFRLALKIVCDEDGKVVVISDITTKAPRPKRTQSWLWLSRGHNLVTENPKQPLLFPREVIAPAGDAAPREAAERNEDSPRGV